MDAYDVIVSKLDVRNFASRHVPGEIKHKILEAARMTGSSMNSQHWRFVLIQDRTNLKKLAQDSTTGQWIEKADFAILILVNPKIPGNVIDAGRVLQDMELAAWNLGVISGLFTGIKQDAVRKDFAVPGELNPAAVLGFGYPPKKVQGRNKDRKPLEELFSLERYGTPFRSQALS